MVDSARSSQYADKPARPTLPWLAAWEGTGAAIGVVALLVFAAVAAPAFYDSGNVFNLVRQASILGLVALGQTLVLLGRGLDLSVGGVIGVTTVAVAEVSAGQNSQLPAGVALALALGLGVGLANGLLIAKRQVPPFVATLGMFVLIEGGRLAYTHGSISGTLPPDLRVVALGSLGPLPYALLLWVGLNAVFGLLLHFTPYGRKLYAVGASPEAARLSGVSVDRIIISTYIFSSLLAVAAGLVLGGYIGYVDRFVGRGSDLDSIAAAVVGGTSFAGGRGGLAGTVAGVLLVSLLLNLVLILGLNAQLQLVVKGVVIVGAVALYMYRQRTAD